jgi:hypothetical protein
LFGDSVEALDKSAFGNTEQPLDEKTVDLEEVGEVGEHQRD